ncbi:tetratricopeptide repeat protein [Seonamhaeicola marinus]|uniref:Tetratricopeptide repeat protein n=1 Tax=Seonamhaeicola marinus TaxID=1912246 RepID=A0A5D0HSZ0_9FLAO|nr:hypothetical protein [Seonamhaeicola marinus]TYA74454.1 hypothetical protein FUA24_14110 [Seonamhaeicola marinus]
MKRLLVVVLLVSGFTMAAQSNADLVKHYEAFYAQMKKQGDIRGVINAMTHLNVLAPSQARKDTLAYIYMDQGMNTQAINTIGYEQNANDSDIAIQVKALALKALKEPKRAITFFEEMFKRNPNAVVAYELAELNIQIRETAEAEKHINYGLANSKEDMKKAYFESQQPYEVPLKAGFMYLNAINTFTKDPKTNIDAAVDILDAALKEAPNFNMIQITKNELLRQKQVLQAQAEKEKK